MPKKSKTEEAVCNHAKTHSSPPPHEPSLLPSHKSPRESPYISDAIYLSFCPTAPLYLIPRSLLTPFILSTASYGHQALPGNSPSCIVPVLVLYNVDPEVAHTFVHYLYTGTYQTLNGPTPFAYSPSQSEDEREHHRALLTYSAASEYELKGLQELAMERAESIGVPAWCKIRDVEMAYRDIERQDEWLDKYLTGAIEAFVETGHGERDRLNMELESIFSCSLVDAVLKLAGKCQRKEDQQGLEMPLAPGVDVADQESSHAQSNSDGDVIDLDDYLDCASGNTHSFSEADTEDDKNVGHEFETANWDDDADQVFVRDENSSKNPTRSRRVDFEGTFGNTYSVALPPQPPIEPKSWITRRSTPRKPEQSKPEVPGGVSAPSTGEFQPTTRALAAANPNDALLPDGLASKVNLDSKWTNGWQDDRSESSAVPLVISPKSPHVLTQVDAGIAGIKTSKKHMGSNLHGMSSPPPSPPRPLPPLDEDEYERAEVHSPEKPPAIRSQSIWGYNADFKSHVKLHLSKGISGEPLSAPPKAPSDVSKNSLFNTTEPAIVPASKSWDSTSFKPKITKTVTATPPVPSLPMPHQPDLAGNNSSPQEIDSSSSKGHNIKDLGKCAPQLIKTSSILGPEPSNMRGPGDINCWFPSPPGPQLSHPAPPLAPFPAARTFLPATRDSRQSRQSPSHGTTSPVPSSPPIIPLSAAPPPPPFAPSSSNHSRPPPKTQCRRPRFRMTRRDRVGHFGFVPNLPPPPPFAVDVFSTPLQQQQQQQQQQPPPPPPPVPAVHMSMHPGEGFMQPSGIGVAFKPSPPTPPPPPPLPPLSPDPSENGGATCPLMSTHLSGRGWRRCGQCRALVMLATQVARAQSKDEDESESERESIRSSYMSEA